MEPNKQVRKEAKRRKRQSLEQASKALRRMLRTHWREWDKPSPIRAMADRIREKEKARILQGDA